MEQPSPFLEGPFPGHFKSFSNIETCHGGIFFAFFKHFLHSLFSLFIHFPLCFMRLFSMIFLNPYGQFYYLNLFYLILSYCSDKISHSFPYFLSEHTLGRRWTASVLEDDHRRTTHNEEQEKNGYLQDLWFPHPQSLDGPQPQLSLPPLPIQSKTDFEPPHHHSEVSLGWHQPTIPPSSQSNWKIPTWNSWDSPHD